MVSRLELARVNITDPTYHHFTGSGNSDSDLDILLLGGGDGVKESLVDQCCKILNPTMFSHHDLIISSCTIPHIQHAEHDVSRNISAPRIPNERFSTRWS
jgi:hypothetical protein